MKILIVLLAAASVAYGAASNKCILLKALQRHGLNDSVTATFMCIADHKTHFNPLQRDNDVHHGMFQINSQLWCKGDKYGSQNRCNIDCKNLEDNCFDDDVECAVTIFVKQGFMAWRQVYQQNCEKKDLTPYLKACDSPMCME